MKTTIFKFKYLFFALIIAALASCKGEIGPPGEDGVDGADGNANVQTYVFNNPTWNGAYWMDFDMSAYLTDTILQTHVILGYVKSTGYDLVNPIPGMVAGSKQYYVNIFNSLATTIPFVYRIISYDLDGTGSETLLPTDWVKIIIIAPTNVTVNNPAKSNAEGKQAIYDELENAGVDINNYYQVMEYYGLDY